LHTLPAAGQQTWPAVLEQGRDAFGAAFLRSYLILLSIRF
jgi:hypothetical protein